MVPDAPEPAPLLGDSSSSKVAGDEVVPTGDPVVAEEGADLAGWDAQATAESLKHVVVDGMAKVYNTSNDKRIQRYLDVTEDYVSSRSPEVAHCMSACAPLLIYAVTILWYLVIPVYCVLYYFVYQVLRRLPWNGLQMIFGVALCFFGGTFTTTLAAAEAFIKMGGYKFRDDAVYILSQSGIISKAWREDDEVDTSQDGVPNVEGLSASEYVAHEIKVALMAVEDPERLRSAAGNLGAAYMSVLVVLKFEFAWVTALALGIADMLKFPIFRISSRAVVWGLGPDLKKWARPLIETTVQVIAIIIAWELAIIITAFYSALRGGRLFADGLFKMFLKNGWKLPSCLGTDPDASYCDELIAYTIAATGFWFQLKHFFMLPFPWDIALLPITILEWWLRFQVSWLTSTSAGAESVTG